MTALAVAAANNGSSRPAWKQLPGAMESGFSDLQESHNTRGHHIMPLLPTAAPGHCQMLRYIEAARDLRRGFLGSYHVFFYLLFDRMGRDAICYSK